jgi:hypothetical protein
MPKRTIASKHSPSAQHQRLESCRLHFVVIPRADAPLDQRHNPTKVIDSPLLGEESEFGVLTGKGSPARAAVVRSRRSQDRPGV